MTDKAFHGGEALAKAVERAYEQGQTDYSLEPMVLVDDAGAPVGKIRNGDHVVFCCRRGEREIELTEAFTDAEFPHFEREYMPDLDFAIMTMYHEKFKNLPIAFAPERVQKPLAQVLSEAGLRQFHCSESEKFAHVTFFFNGGYNQPFPGETDLCIPSPKGIAFDQKPELSLPAVAEKVEEAVDEGYDFIVTNFANGDVIGHTANTQAKLAAAAAISRYVDRVAHYAKEKGYVVAVTADHGNIEALYTKEGKPHGAHTTNLVPFIVLDPKGRELALHDGRLGDVAPTVLSVLGIEKPAEMTGRSLIDTPDFRNDKMMLIILDGWGFGTRDEGDAIYLADTPGWDALLQRYPNAKLRASGEDVGLQTGKAGNSEAGHNNLGAGRIVAQDDVRMDSAIKDGSFRKNPVFLHTINAAKEEGSALHLLSYLTLKSSHGCIDYPLMLTEMAEGVDKVFLHIIFDGRSTEPGSAPQMLRDLDEKLAAIGRGVIVDGVGRGIALDRDKNYAKVRRAYEAMTLGKGTSYQA
ncbi:MAG: phosphoglycerate mutase (2,3-diphosphoglycerate-independent) [Oscillospiraceae bacterium]|nr:phosphoglycerate mutase (2,3-diphosphoglycerate-independent) [Oscillospiraceae bacterium]